jgi:hypothetical protein
MNSFGKDNIFAIMEIVFSHCIINYIVCALIKQTLTRLSIF